MEPKNTIISVRNWLLLGCILIGLMVLVGGITRLTQSGLSMVKWEPIMGIIPPLNESDWNDSFNQYKQSPEFQFYNKHFTLLEYKKIFFWEYLHRLIARIIGLVFIVPCVYFWIRGHFSKSMKYKVLMIFLFGFLQGLMGWLMVKSGLVDKPHVSHFRLAAHFILALFLMSYIYWVVLTLRVRKKDGLRHKVSLPVILFGVALILQLVYGAFVAGLKAGLMYNTFPLMGSNWIPPEFWTSYRMDGFSVLLDHGGFVQLIHRVIAVVLLLIFSVLLLRMNRLSADQRSALIVLGGLLGLQLFLGVFTLLSVVQLELAVIHQFIAMLLFLAYVRLYFRLKFNTE